jgi:hypothetical protein
MSPKAAAHFQKGGNYFNAQLYKKAITEFQAGYLIDPQPEFLYAIGQAQRLEGDCKDALVAYQHFLSMTSTWTDADSVSKQANARDRINECNSSQTTATTPATQATQGTMTTPTPVPTPKPAGGGGTTPAPSPSPSVWSPRGRVVPGSTTPVANPDTSRASMETAAWIAAGGTGAALLTGIVATFVRAHEVSAFNDNAACSQQANGTILGGGACQNAYTSGQEAQTVEIVGYATAGGLAITSGILFWLAYRPAESSTAGATTASLCEPTLGAFGVVCAGRF